MTRNHSAAAAYGLTPLQEGMLYDHLTSADRGIDIEQVVGTFNESLDVRRYEAAWISVVTRHEVLRTRYFLLEDGRPRQEVVPRVDHPFSVDDLSNSTDEEADSRVAEFLVADRARGFKLDQAPASRVHVFLKSGDRYVLVWTFHHVLLDGRSQPRVLRDVYQAYKSMDAGIAPPISDPIPYRAHIEAVEQFDGSGAEAYWRERLACLQGPTRLPQSGVGAGLADRPQGHDEASRTLTTGQHASLREAITSGTARWNSIIQAAWAVVLSRYANEDCVAFGSIRASQPPTHPGQEGPVGFYINNVPMIVQVDEGRSLRELADSVQTNQARETSDLEHVPLSAIQSWSQLAPGTQLFDSIVVYDHRDLNGALRELGPRWASRDVRLLEQNHFPATLLMFREPQLRMALRYDRRSFDPAIVHQILGHLERVLLQFAASPDRPLREYTLLGSDERHTLIHGFNAAHVDYPQDETLNSRFRAQVERSPGAVALISDEATWTYQELSDRAAAVAAALIHEGVGPETVVGVMVERSCEMMAAILGIVRAGGAYLPLNPEDPAARLGYMLETASAQIVLVQRGLRDKLGEPTARLLPIEDAIRHPVDGAMQAPGPMPGHLAYVIFTSGSTGRPKGVMVEHRSICNRLRWMQDAFALVDADRVFQKTPLTFDVSVWEVFWPILEGASIVLAAPGRHRDSRYIKDTVRSRGVTFMHFVPSMLRLFLGEAGLAESCGTLRGVVCSGEELTRSDIAKFNGVLQVPLHNLYGPTEAAVDVSHWRCDAPACCNTVPIGRSIANTRLFVLDRYGEPCPIGVPGELFIAGVQVARGYIGRPDLTQERFSTDGLSGLGGRMYRTGDRARWLPDASLEFLGRNDFEIKLHGIRVDLAEIESAIREIPAVDDAVVVARVAPGDQKRLIAYYTTLAPVSESELRSHLRQILQTAVIPSVFVELDAIPLNAAGKVDRAQLPEPREPVPVAGVAPRSDLESTIASIWAEALGLAAVGRDENFFDLGGQSMILLSVHRKIEERLGVEYPVTKSLEHTTVKSLASYLEDTSATSPRVARGRARGARRRDRTRPPAES